MYDVRISPTAEGELFQILEYISVELANPQAASRMADELTKQWQALSDMPLRYPLFDDQYLR